MIYIYCDYVQPGGVERVSLRLNDFLNRNGIKCEVISSSGGGIFGRSTKLLSSVVLHNNTVIFSRKKDIRRILPLLNGSKLIYWRHVPFSSNGFVRKYLDILFCVLISRMGQIVCVCDELKDEVKSVRFIMRTNIYSCMTPTESSVDKPIKGVSCARVIRLVYFGREGAQKKLSHAVKMVEEANNLQLDVRLDVYGYSDSKWESVYGSRKVTFCGETNDPIHVLSQSDGLVLLSKYEGFPTALVEAAICGVPIFCNSFQTGLLDFENIVGPTNRLELDDPKSLYFCLMNVKLGFYRVSALGDENIVNQWCKAL